ncbi:hypothetical protein GW721_05770 [Citrobacter braakii]|nr:hypothetical protein [Citrobacter braakii]
MLIIKMTTFAILLISITLTGNEVIAGTKGYINFNGSINVPACSFKNDKLAMKLTCFQQNREETNFVSLMKVGKIFALNETVTVLFLKHSTNQSIMQMHITYQ